MIARLRLRLIFLFLFPLFALYAQEVTVTDFSIIAENLDIGGMPSLRERYDRIVDKDIQELMSRENIQYIDTFFSSREAHPWIGLEKSFLIEDLFLENIPNAWEEFIIYRLRFKQDDMVFVVYTMLAAPFSFISHFRIFVRAIE